MERGTLVCLLLVLAAAAGAADAQTFVGDDCRAKGDAAGTCRIISECPEVRAALLKGESPITCSYEGFTPIVCCPKSSPPTQRPSDRPTTGSSHQPGGSPSGSVATRMCSKYAESVFRYEKTFQIPPQRVRVDQCANKGLPFIVGGEKAISNEFPHMALLGFGDNPQEPNWGCGGSLISESFVLTAAHCFFTRAGRPKIVRLGELNLKTTKELNQHQDISVAQSIPHPEYRDGVAYHDLGLVRLAKDVVFTASIRPVCLQTETEIGAKDAVASGWGWTDWATPEISEHLMKVKLPIQKTEACNTAFKTLSTTSRLRKGIVEDSMICAGTLQIGKDTCRGDSGGPLQLKLETPYCMYRVVGITSFGPKNCGTTKSPAVYTRVSHYVSWIESVAWPNQK